MGLVAVPDVPDVPEGLAVMAAGPALAAVLDAVPLSDVPNDRVLDVMRAQYRQLCHEQARMAVVLAEVARCTGVGPGQVVRVEEPGRYAAEETRAALRWTRHAAEQEHFLAETVVFGMPQLFAAWLAGEVDRSRVRVFDRYLTGLGAEQVTRICGVAVPRAPKLTTGQLAHLLRRMVIAVDPDAAARWYRQGVRDRDVSAYPAPDGTVTMSAHGLPADEAQAACVRVQEWAAATKRAGHPGRIGHIRSDLFLGLLDGRFHGMTLEQVIGVLMADYRPAGPAGEAPAPAAADPAGPAAAHQSAPESAPAAPDTGDPLDTGGPVDAGDPAADGDAADPGGAGDAVDDGEAGCCEVDLGDAGPPPPAPSPPPGPLGPPSAWADPGCEGVGDGRVGIEIRIGLGTLLGRDEHPAEIPGLGFLIAPDARLRIAFQGRSEWRFAVTDPAGVLLSEGRTRLRPAWMGRVGPRDGIVELHVPATLLAELVADPAGCGGWGDVVADIAAQYAASAQHLRDLDAHPDDRLPGAGLRRHTEIRDRTCSFAGVCRHPAHRADIDHTHDHAHGGATVRINLGPLCEHDHAVKHEAGWTVTQPEPGLFVWHSPLGGVYPTRGEFLLPELPDPVPPEPETKPYTFRHLEGPILRRPPPPPAPTPPPPPKPPDRDSDEPPF